MINESHTVRTTRRRRKETDLLQLGTNAKTPNSHDSSSKARDRRCKGRQKSKNKYRRKNAQPSSPPLASSAAQSPSNGYATPKSDTSRVPALVTTEHCEDSPQRRCHKVTDQDSDARHRKSHLLPQNPYVTPSSPAFSIARAQQFYKPKGVIQQKRHRDADRAYRGLRTVLQPFEPISSRLRSRGYLYQKGTL